MLGSTFSLDFSIWKISLFRPATVYICFVLGVYFGMCVCNNLNDLNKWSYQSVRSQWIPFTPSRIVWFTSVDVWNPAITTCHVKNLFAHNGINMGINYQPQVVNAGFQPSSVPLDRSRSFLQWFWRIEVMAIEPSCPCKSSDASFACKWYSTVIFHIIHTDDHIYIYIYLCTCFLMCSIHRDCWTSS